MSSLCWFFGGLCQCRCTDHVSCACGGDAWLEARRLEATSCRQCPGWYWSNRNGWDLGTGSKWLREPFSEQRRTRCLGTNRQSTWRIVCFDSWYGFRILLWLGCSGRNMDFSSAITNLEQAIHARMGFDFSVCHDRLEQSNCGIHVQSVCVLATRGIFGSCHRSMARASCVLANWRWRDLRDWTGHGTGCGNL